MPHLLAAGARFPVEAVLLDKDGTLMDFIFTWGRWSERLLASCSGELGLSGEAIPAAMARLLGTRHAADGTPVGYERGGPLATGTVEDILAIVAWQGYQSGLSWPAAKEAALRAKQAADAALEDERAVRLLPHVLPFLESCRAAGIPLAVVTADETAAADNHLQWLGIRHYFAAVVGTDRAERGKPFPDLALLACHMLGANPARAAVIGDTDGDMQMAKAAGAAAAIGIAGNGEAGGEVMKHADVVVSGWADMAVQE